MFESPGIAQLQMLGVQPVGQATGFVEQRGFGVDLRLTPAQELDRVALPLHLAWSDARTDCAAAVARLDRPRLGKGISAGRIGAAALLLDVGEEGTANYGPQGVACRLFDAFLEKGVIVVARWAVRPWEGEAALLADLAAWLDAPPAL